MIGIAALTALALAADQDTASSLAGTWQLELTIATRTPIPMIGTVRTRSLTVARVDITTGEEGYLAVQRVCSSDVMDQDGLVQTVLPPAFVRAIPARTYPVRVGADGALHADLGVEATGWTGQGELPAGPDDPRVRDFDKDGKPGATVLVTVRPFGTGEVYVVHVGHSRLEGRLVSPDRGEGRVILERVEQRTIGASPRILGGTLEAIPDPERSRFILRRIEPARACTPAAAGG
jgi:hypothetical protein